MGEVEYMTVRISAKEGQDAIKAAGSLDDYLNLLGRDGWRWVGHMTTDGYTSSVVFMRDKPAPQSPGPLTKPQD